MAVPKHSRNGTIPLSHGAVAQLGERLVRNEEVRGSIPLGSTKSPPNAWMTYLPGPVAFDLRQRFASPLFLDSRELSARMGYKRPGTAERAAVGPKSAAAAPSGQPSRC